MGGVEVSEKRLNTCGAVVMEWNGEGGVEVKYMLGCSDWLGRGGERLVRRG